MSLAASSKLNYLKRQINKISRKDSEPQPRDEHTREQLSMTMLSPGTHNSSYNATIMKNKMNSSTLKKYSYQEPAGKKPFKKKSKLHTMKANSFAVEPKDRDIFELDAESDKNLNNATSIKDSHPRNFARKDHANTENTYLKKTPVNIFNIKNYNILKSENSKREQGSRKENSGVQAARKGSSVKNKSGSPKMNHKIHNFFVFIGLFYFFYSKKREQRGNCLQTS
jgi:hypothetical protein